MPWKSARQPLISGQDGNEIERARLRQIPLVLPRHHFIRGDIRIERVEILRAADAAQRIAAGGHQIVSPGGVEAGAERRRHQKFPVDRAAHRGDAADLVDGRPHHGEVEPVVAADIAVKHLADMQADMGRRHRPAFGHAAGGERLHVAAEAMFGAQCGAFSHRQVVVGEHRQHAVADQLQHLAAGVVDGVDRGLRIIIEERDDLAGIDAFADRGRAAQVGEPQYRVDLLGDAARDFSAQHLLSSIAPEIDPAQRPGDIGLRRGLDRKPQHRHEVAQRRQPLGAKALVAPRHPIGIDAVHLPHGAGLAEPVHIGHQMLVALLGKFAHEFEIVGPAIGEVDRQLLMAVFEHVIEDRVAPGFGGFALVGRAIFEDVAFVGLGIVPAKAAALENRVQRVDEDHPARHRDALGAAAFAKTADQVIFGQACETLADQPVHQA